MIFAVKEGLVDGKCIDELLGLAPEITAQAGKITDERGGAGSTHPLLDPPLDVIPFGLGEHHPGSAVEKLA